MQQRRQIAYDLTTFQGNRGAQKVSGWDVMQENVLLSRKPAIRVVGQIYDYDVPNGRVDCLLCGSRAFSRNREAIVVWQIAHSKCCKQQNQSTDRAPAQRECAEQAIARPA